MLPEVSYRATAVRPRWHDLPESLRDAIGSRLGGPIAAVRSAGGGFTRAFAAGIETANGGRAFIKAAPLREATAEWYAREASITAALPSAVAAPRPRWTMSYSGYFALCLDLVDGVMPELPWVPAELEAAVAAWTTASSALATPPLSGLPHLSDIVRREMSVWSRGGGPSVSHSLAVIRSAPPQAAPPRDDTAPPEPAPPVDTGAPPQAASPRDDPAPPEPAPPVDAVAPPQAAPPRHAFAPPGAGSPQATRPLEAAAAPTVAPFRSAALSDAAVVSELAALERLLPDAVAGSGMLHGDLRIDNVLIDRDGKAWLCDWTWPCLGAPWFDLVTLLVTAYASGAQVDRFLAGTPAEGVDAALAGLAGYWLSRAAGPPSSASPHSRQHQAYSGRAALSWLSARRGWL